MKLRELFTEDEINEYWGPSQNSPVIKHLFEKEAMKLTFNELLDLTIMMPVKCITTSAFVDMLKDKINKS